MTRTSRFPAVAKRRQPSQLGSAPAAMIVASLFAAAVFFQPTAHATHAECRLPRLQRLSLGHPTAHPRSPSSKRDFGSATTSVRRAVLRGHTALPAARISKN